MIFIVVFILTTFISGVADADTEVAKIHAPLKLERIIDGDTLKAGGRTIRLWGIDAPERDDVAGPAATMLLKSLLADETEIYCKYIEHDRYDRFVMHCLSGDLDIASMMVQMGMARDYRKYSGGYYQYEQERAQEARRGIWK